MSLYIKMILIVGIILFSINLCCLLILWLSKDHYIEDAVRDFEIDISTMNPEQINAIFDEVNRL